MEPISKNMPYFFQKNNSRKFLVANYLRYNFDSNQLETDKAIYSFIPSNSDRIENFSAETTLPILEYDNTTSTYILGFSSFDSLYIQSKAPLASSVYISKNRALSSSTFSYVLSNGSIYIDTYGLSGDKVFTFTNTESAYLNYLGTGEDKILKGNIVGNLFFVDILLRDTTTGNITAKTDTIGYSFDSSAAAYFRLNSITLDSDIWGYSYNTYTSDLSIQKQNFLYFDSLTYFYNNSGFKAPSLLPFTNSRYDISNGYTSLSSTRKRNKLYILDYDSSTKTYTLSDGPPYTAANNYDNTFFYPGLSTRVYHNNRVKDVLITNVLSGSFLFQTATDAWGTNFTVPVSARWRNYVLDEKIPYTDITAGTWKLFDTPFVNNVNLSGIVLSLSAAGYMPKREAGILSSYSIPFNIFIDEATFKYRSITPASGGKPQRWITSQATAFKEYNNLICPLSTFYQIKTHNILPSENISYSNIEKSFNKRVVLSVDSVSSFNVINKRYDLYNNLADDTLILPLTCQPVTGYPTTINTHSYDLLSSVSFLYLSGSGVVLPGINGIYRVDNEFPGGYPAYINGKNVTVIFDSTENKWLIRAGSSTYYASDEGISYPWETTSWELCASGILPVPTASRVFSNYGIKTTTTKNFIYVLDSNRLQIHIYSTKQSFSLDGTYFVYNIPSEMGPEYCDYMEIVDIVACPTFDGSLNDYVCLVVKYEKHSDIGNYFYGVKVLNTAGNEGAIKRFDIDSSLYNHVSSFSYIKDIKISVGFNKANNKQNNAYLFIARPNNTHFAGCTGSIDIFNINTRLHEGYKNINDTLFLTTNPTLSNYIFGAAIAADKDSLAYTLSSNSTSNNVVECASLSSFRHSTVPVITGFNFTPEKYFESSSPGYGKQLEISSLLGLNAYNKIKENKVIDTDRLVVLDNNNVNLYEKIFSEFQPVSSINLISQKVFLDGQTIILLNNNALKFASLSAVTNKYF